MKRFPSWASLQDASNSLFLGGVFPLFTLLGGILILLSFLIGLFVLAPTAAGY